ncbi:MAG: hypothetical protein ACJAYX_000417 [Planctomycetota bacterium]|jgi:hypothetical protein
MFGSGLRFWLAALVAPLLLTSCASYYELEVTGTPADHNRSVFLIVCEKDDLKLDSELEEELVDLTSSKRAANYLMFGQYDAEAGGELSWKEVHLAREFPHMVSVELSEDLSSLTMVLNKSLGESYGNLAICVLSTDRYGRWFDRRVSATAIDLGSELQLQLDAGKFVDLTAPSMIPELKQ